MSSERLARKKERSRTALLDAALAQFASRGLHAPSIEDITVEADLGKGTFYRYFSSREDLIAALVRRCVDDLVLQVERGAPEAATGVQRIRHILRAHGQFFQRHPGHLILLHQARGWMKLRQGPHRQVREELDRYLEKMEAFLPDPAAGVSARSRSRRRMALVLSGFISGVLSFEHILGGPLDSVPDLPADAALLVRLLGG